jgi:hypothetical protein
MDEFTWALAGDRLRTLGLREKQRGSPDSLRKEPRLSYFEIRVSEFERRLAYGLVQRTELVLPDCSVVGYWG